MSTRGKCTLSSCRVTLFSVISKSTPNKPSVVSFFSLSHVYETGADKHTNARMNFNYLKWFQSIKKHNTFLETAIIPPQQAQPVAMSVSSHLIYTRPIIRHLFLGTLFFFFAFWRFIFSLCQALPLQHIIHELIVRWGASPIIIVCSLKHLQYWK